MALERFCVLAGALCALFAACNVGGPTFDRDQTAETVFQATRGVLLEVTGELDAYGWLPVKHAGGLAGWMPGHEAWGR